MCRDLRKINNIDVIGIGGLITIYDNLKRLMLGLREISLYAKIVLGGGWTVESEVIFENMSIDFCFHGEGAYTFVELCAAIERRECDFSHIAKTSYIEKAKMFRTLSRPLEKDLDVFPMHAMHTIYFQQRCISRIILSKTLFENPTDSKVSMISYP